MLAVVVVLTALVMPGAAWAQGGTLDQSSEGRAAGFLGTVNQQTQTFTAGRTGVLDRIELNGFLYGEEGQVTIQITAVDQSGQPTGPALGSGSFNAGDLPSFTGSVPGAWVSVSISPPVAAGAGVQYAIVKPQGEPSRFGWTFSVGNPYPHGKLIPASREDFDYLFRTYVLTPTTPTCNGLAATVYVQDGKIVGGPDNDKPYDGSLIGTAGDDVMVGTEGRDAINGRTGNDTICALGGNDRIEGADGNDTMYGGAGGDRFKGGAGTDSAPDFNTGEGDSQEQVEQLP
jgi:Ca2+-binding RTX toxin-like protein